MTRTILFLLILSVATVGKSNGQNIYSEVSFLKATNHLFSASLSLDAIMKADNQETEVERNLPSLKANLAQSQKFYTSLKGKYSTNKQLTQLKQWNDLLKKIIDGFASDNWQSDPTWQLGYSLLKMDLVDMVNKKIQ